MQDVTNEVSLVLTIQVLPTFNINITVYNDEGQPCAFETQMLIFSHPSLNDQIRNSSWVFSSKMEYVGRLSPFSLLWKQPAVNIFLNASQQHHATEEENLVRVLSLSYQIIESELETVPDRKTVMSVHKVDELVCYRLFCLWNLFGCVCVCV